MKKPFAIALLSLAAAGSHAADCESPEMPNLPDGGSATMDDMLAGQKAVKKFQTSNIEYMKCLEENFTAAKAAALDEDASAEERAAAAERHSAGVEAYNAAVSAEESVAGQFNTEIREYKAANPK
jgi:hypothetical protein